MVRIPNPFPSCVTDRSLDESLIRSLEACSSAVDAALSVYIWLVVIGLVFEIAIIIAEYMVSLKKWRRALIEPPEKPTVPELMFHLIGAVLIAIGVGGELWAHNESGKINRDLVIANRSLEAKRTRESEEKLAPLRINAANAEAELLRLRQGVADRVLDSKGKAKLLSLLTGAKFVPITIEASNSADTEQSFLGRDIQDALFAVKWADDIDLDTKRRAIICCAFIGGEPLARDFPVGMVTVFSTADDEAIQLIPRLVGALNAAEIATQAGDLKVFRFPPPIAPAPFGPLKSPRVILAIGRKAPITNK